MAMPVEERRARRRALYVKERVQKVARARLASVNPFEQVYPREYRSVGALIVRPAMTERNWPRCPDCGTRLDPAKGPGAHCDPYETWCPRVTVPGWVRPGVTRG